jgi:endonuclease YncB( thermonuclease family)
MECNPDDGLAGPVINRNRIRPEVSSVLASLLAGVAIIAALVIAHGANAASRVESGTVVSVYDGDTLTLANGERVRLLQIDTPELGSGECYSRAARTELLRLVPVGSRVVLEADSRLDRVDRYGRLLRYVRREGLNVNVELVRRGAAAPYFYQGDRGHYANTLMAAAMSAKRSKRGLWKACPGTVLDPYRAVDTGESGPAVTNPSPTSTPAAGRCDPNYAGGCVPPYPPDVDCADIRALGMAPVRVVGHDPHRLDGDGDGYGCED